MLDFVHEHYLYNNQHHPPNKRSKTKNVLDVIIKQNAFTGSVINASVYCLALIRKIPRIVFLAAISCKTFSSVKYSSHDYDEKIERIYDFKGQLHTTTELFDVC